MRRDWDVVKKNELTVSGRRGLRVPFPPPRNSDGKAVSTATDIENFQPDSRNKKGVA